jgi:uncharacterized protein (TIGR02757 family)
MNDKGQGFDFMEMKSFLDEKVDAFNKISFIDDDPISVPHQFTERRDIEIAAFLTASIAWGNRKSILKSAGRMMDFLDNRPYEFVIGHTASDIKSLSKFVHRTFNGQDFISFIRCLSAAYHRHPSLEDLFLIAGGEEYPLSEAISRFRNDFFSAPHAARSEKHVSDPMSGSAAKRINMFLRWMVRHDNRGVDFGLWNKISPSALSIPLDVHSGNIARKLGLLSRKQNDQKAVLELDAVLRQFDRADPCKYDFALFGLGAIEGF